MTCLVPHKNRDLEAWSHQCNWVCHILSHASSLKRKKWFHSQSEQGLLGALTSDMQMTPPLWQKVKRNSKAPLMKAQHSENEDHGSWSHHFMGNRWGNSGNSVRLYFFGLQNHYRWWLQHEIKRHLLLGRKVMTNLDSILKSRDITLPTKVRLVKAIVFPIVMYGCESWTIKRD